MTQAILAWFANELKSTPMALVGMCILAFFVHGLFIDHVSIAQFKTLQDQMQGVQFTLQHDHLDTRLHQIESEVFTLSQHVVDEKSKGHGVDSLYSIRIDELTRQDNDTKREIDLLDRSGAPIPLHR